jgi:hypothetical protein
MHDERIDKAERGMVERKALNVLDEDMAAFFAGLEMKRRRCR